MAFQRDTQALAEVAGRLGWDQETVMPRGAAEQRSEEMGAIEAVLHARRTDPRIGDFRVVASHQESLHSHDAVSILTKGDTFRQASYDPRLFDSLYHVG